MIIVGNNDVYSCILPKSVEIYSIETQGIKNKFVETVDCLPSVILYFLPYK